VFAHVATGASAGTSYELPRLGKFSWENALANPGTGTATVVAGTDDSTPGQVYLYQGTKTNDANPVVAAGLTNGTLGGISVAGLATESDTSVISGPTAFTVAGLGDVSGRTGAQLEADSTAAGVTKFARPEDGSWDPARPNDFYFVTTASFGRKDDAATPANEYTAGLSRLWRLRFVDAANPSLGGTAEVLYESPAYDPAQTDATQSGPRMMDNLTVVNGEVLIQEDPGNNAYLAGIWQYDIAGDTMRRVYAHDASLFAPGSAGFVTQDEESSGIIPVFDLIGPRTFLAVTQVHKASADPELVEDGQLVAIKIPPSP
jgi:secreted PhoX family phosphatase